MLHHYALLSLYLRPLVVRGNIFEATLIRTLRCALCIEDSANVLEKIVSGSGSDFRENSRKPVDLLRTTKLYTMLFRLLLLQLIAQLANATPKEASLVNNKQVKTDIIQNIVLGAENPSALVKESVEMVAAGKSNELIVNEIPSPEGNIGKSSMNKDQPAVCSDPQNVRVCGTTITQSGTLLRSPISSNSNLLYPASTDCKWNIEAPVGMTITVVTLCDFETASTAPSFSNCYEDYVEFLPSDGRDAIVCGSYTGFSYKTLVNLLTIRFRSNSDSNVGAGFVFRIDFVDEGQPDVCYDPQTLRDCGTTITEDGTILRSPITSSNNLLYPPSTTCEWYVEAPPNYDIHVVSLCEFGTAPLLQTLSCRADYLEFALSNGETSRVCGGLTSFSVNTTGGANKLSIRFRSDSDDEVGRGFVVKIIFNDGTGMFRCGSLLMTLSVVAYALLSV